MIVASCLAAKSRTAENVQPLSSPKAIGRTSVRNATGTRERRRGQNRRRRKMLVFAGFSRVGDFFQNITGLISRVFVSVAIAKARFPREKREFFGNNFSRRFLSIDSFYRWWIVDVGSRQDFFWASKIKKCTFLFNRVPRWLIARTQSSRQVDAASCRIRGKSGK